MTQQFGDDAAAQLQQPASTAVAIAPDLAHAVDLYWLALQKLQTLIEDIEGADGRLEYLKMLRFRLIEFIQEMDGILNTHTRAVGRSHALPYALQNGIEFLELSGVELTSKLRLHEPLDIESLQQCLLQFSYWVLGRLPGQLPNAQGAQGQREVLRAMRGWSATSSVMGEDLGFLAARIRDL